MAQDKVVAVELSNYESGFYEMLGVQQAQSADVNKILKETASARYEKGSAAEQAAMTGKLVSAIHEAYPDLKVLNIYSKVADYIATGREKIKGEQKELVAVAADYQKWLRGGALQPTFCQWAGRPSVNLTCEGADGEELSGWAALKHLSTPIVTSSTRNAQRTRTAEPLKMPSANQ